MKNNEVELYWYKNALSMINMQKHALKEDMQLDTMHHVILEKLHEYSIQ